MDKEFLACSLEEDWNQIAFSRRVEEIVELDVVFVQFLIAGFIGGFVFDSPDVLYETSES